MTTRSTLVLFALALVCTGAFGQLGSGPDVDITLPADGHDMAYDAGGGLLYVSMPTMNAVAIVSLQTMQVIGMPAVGGSPRGIDVSIDGTHLYVALNGSSAVAALDLSTLAVDATINVATATGHPSTWDVVEGKPNRVFVTANPGSSGISRVALIDRDMGDAVTTVASNKIIRAAPTITRSPTQTELYIGEGFSPNSLYGLDITTNAAPKVVEDQHGTVSGTQFIDIDPTGTRVVLRSGQILDTATFTQVGAVGGGAPRYSGDGSKIYVAPDSTTLEEWDVATQLMTTSHAFPCASTQTITGMVLLPGDAGVLVLSGAHICGITDQNTQMCSLPGSGEDFVMLTQGNTTGCKNVMAGQLLVIDMSSPLGTFVGVPPVVIGQVVPAGTVLTSPGGFPEIHLDVTVPGIAVFFDGSVAPGPFGPVVLPAAGLTLSYVVPGGLGGLMARIQSFALDSSAANGIFAASDGHDLLF